MIAGGQRCWIERKEVPSQYGPTTQDVQHCSLTGSRDQVDYWDVTYEFRSIFHRTQRSYRPGQTVTVNVQGEPRE